MSLFWVNGKPTRLPEDWKQSLQEPERQWRPGFSAWALAHSWETAQGFPSEIHWMLSPQFSGLTFVRGLVEHPVPMPGMGKASHNDLFVEAKSQQGDLCIAVEGKVSEDLGPTVTKWRDGNSNKEKRLAGILDSIGLPHTISGKIRYQLLHRMASPVIEATKHQAQHAVMIVHSFSQLDEHFEDFAEFMKLYGVENPQTSRLYSLKTVDDRQLYAGWVRGDKRFLSKP